MDANAVYNDAKTFINTMFGSQLFDSISPWLTIGKDSKYGQMWGIVANVYDSLSVIGVGLMLLFLTIKILSDITNAGPPTIEMIMKHVSRLIIGYVVITRGFEMLQGLVAFFDDICSNTIANALNGINDSEKNKDFIQPLAEYALNNKELAKAGGEWTAKKAPDGFVEAWEDIDLMDQIITFITIMSHKAEMFIMKGLDIFLVAICITRGVQICAYTMVAPLALAEVVSGHEITSSSAMRFVKKYSAVLLQGGMILLIVYSCRLINASFMTSQNGGMADALGTLGCMFALKVAEVSLVQKSQQFASDVIGG